MKQFFVLKLIILISSYCFGQTINIDAVIYNSLSNERLPFVSIGILNSSKGTVSSIDGKFSIIVRPEDSLTFSSVGYKKKIMMASAIIDKVYLDEETTMLSNIEISAKKYRKEKIIGNHQTKTEYLFGGSNQYAFLLLNPENVEGYIQELNFELQPDIQKSNRIETIVSIKIYQNEKNIPGIDLLPKPIIRKVKKNEKKLKVDVSEFNIVLPHEGFFIGFDFLGTIDSRQTFIPYNKDKTPVNLRIAFNDNPEFVTYSKFFGTEWGKVIFPNKNGEKKNVNAKFYAKVKY